MEMNYGLIALFALIPIVIGFVWYNPKVFGSTWMKTVGLTEEDAKNANMAKTMILAYIFSFLLVMAMHFLTIHQMHVYSILLDETGFGEPGSEVQNLIDSFMANFGNNFRTFKHGAFHGVIDCLFVVLPVLGTNALFEMKGFKYIAINVGYWAITMGVIGGLVCQYAP